MEKLSTRRALMPGNHVFLALWYLFSLVTVDQVRAEEASGRMLEEVYGSAARTVEIATGYAKAPEQAPAVTTVLTAADIDAMGVRTLQAALSSVAGFQWQSGRTNFENVSLRGLNSSFDGRTLLMIDGLPVAQGFGSAHAFRIYDTYPVENIDRIEVIRGPASALYGADAFAGVINVITRTAAQRRGSQFGARMGSFNTYEGWLRHSGSFGPVGVSAYFSGGTSDGQDSTVDADLQTQFDRVFGTRASRAPGPLGMHYERTNADVDFWLGPWRLKLAYFGLQNAGNGIGLDVLDPTGKVASHTAFGDLSFRERFADTIEVNAHIAYTDNGANSSATTLPSGAFGGLFQRGVLDEFILRGRQFRTEGSLLWTGLDDHMVRIGAGYYTRDLYEFAQRSNAITTGDPERGLVLVPTPGEQLVTLSPDQLAVPPKLQRDVTFGFFQDEWHFANDWTLTAGVRVDSYSDFGTSTNPRASLVWNTGPHSTLRLSYGQAFRAPGYFESNGRPNNQLGEGNLNLRPETLQSYELGTSLWGDRYRMNLTVFALEIHNRISTVQGRDGLSRFVNATEDEQGYGMEWEGSWQPTDTWRFRANYTVQQPTGQRTSSIGTAPVHNLYAEAQWKFAPDWFVDLNLKSLIDRRRQVGDLRPDIDDVTLVNIGLHRKQLFGKLDLAVSVRNLFDADARDPSNTTSGVTGDIPVPGINAFGELRVNF